MWITCQRPEGSLLSVYCMSIAVPAGKDALIACTVDLPLQLTLLQLIQAWCVMTAYAQVSPH